MKRLGLTLVVVLMSVASSFAQGNSNKVNKEPFAINFEKLSYYLELAPYQVEEVANINEYFLDMQKQSLRGNAKLRDKRMHQAIYGNLKLMKGALTPEQYRKYVTLLNVTHNNNRMLSSVEL